MLRPSQLAGAIPAAGFMKTIELSGIEFETDGEAFQHADASGFGDCVIHVAGRTFLVSKAEANRLEMLGVVSCHVFDHEMPDGTRRLMTVPVDHWRSVTMNDDVLNDGGSRE